MTSFFFNCFISVKNLSFEYVLIAVMSDMWLFNFCGRERGSKREVYIAFVQSQTVTMLYFCFDCK